MALLSLPLLLPLAFALPAVRLRVLLRVRLLAARVCLRRPRLLLGLSRCLGSSAAALAVPLACALVRCTAAALSLRVPRTLPLWALAGRCRRDGRGGWCVPPVVAEAAAPCAADRARTAAAADPDARCTLGTAPALSVCESGPLPCLCVVAADDGLCRCRCVPPDVARVCGNALRSGRGASCCPTCPCPCLDAPLAARSDARRRLLCPLCACRGGHMTGAGPGSGLSRRRAGRDAAGFAAWARAWAAIRWRDDSPTRSSCPRPPRLPLPLPLPPLLACVRVGECARKVRPDMCDMASLSCAVNVRAIPATYSLKSLDCGVAHASSYDSSACAAAACAACDDDTLARARRRALAALAAPAVTACWPVCTAGAARAAGSTGSTGSWTVLWTAAGACATSVADPSRVGTRSAAPAAMPAAGLCVPAGAHGPAEGAADEAAACSSMRSPPQECTPVHTSAVPHTTRGLSSVVVQY